MTPSMTIRDVRTTLLRTPWPDNPGMKGHGLGSTRISSFEVETEGGVVGMGYLNPLTPVLRTSPHASRKRWCPSSGPGCDRSRGDLAGSVAGPLHRRPRGNSADGDVRGRYRALGRRRERAGLPLHRLWGHFRSEVPAYGSGCWRASGGEGMIAKALDYVAQGFRAIKMQVAHVHDLRTDLEHVRRMREALGPEVEIMVDVNQGWTADVAIQMGRKFEAYDVYWLEEPVLADDFAGYLRVAAALDLRVVGGESHFTRYDLRPFFENPRLPTCSPIPCAAGSPTA